MYHNQFQNAGAMMLSGGGMNSFNSSSTRDDLGRRVDMLEAHLSTLNSRGGSPTPMILPSPTPMVLPMMMPGGGGGGDSVDRKTFMDLLAAHNELMAAHRELLSSHGAKGAAAKNPLQAKIDEAGSGGRVGIVRLDGANYSAPKYSKKSVLGDAASKATWENAGDKVFYQRAEGYTFTVCKYGFIDPKAVHLTFEKQGIIKIKGRQGDANHMYIPNRRGGPKDQPRPRRPSRTEPWIEGGREIGVSYIYESELVMENVKQALIDLTDDCKVDCITSACGFMANVQKLCSDNCKVPCLMSSLNILPVIDLMAGKGTVIIVLTANSVSFGDNYDELIRPSWDIPRSRIELVGLQEVEGFGDEVAQGTTVDVDVAEANIVKAVAAKMEALRPVRVSAILSECTELPGYTNTLRETFSLPVFDAITAANVLLNGLIPRDEYSNKATYG